MAEVDPFWLDRLRVTTAHQDDIIVLRKLVQGYLEGHDAPAGLRIKPLDPGRPVFREPNEAIFGQPVARRPAEELLVIDIGVAEACSRGVSPRSCRLGSAAAPRERPPKPLVWCSRREASARGGSEVTVWRPSPSRWASEKRR
jgi:hypothetical protein